MTTSTNSALSDITILDLCDEKGPAYREVARGDGRAGHQGRAAVRRWRAGLSGRFAATLPMRTAACISGRFNTAKEGITLDIASAKGAEMLRKISREGRRSVGEPRSRIPGISRTWLPGTERGQPRAGDDFADRVRAGRPVPRLQDIGPGGDGHGRYHAQLRLRRPARARRRYVRVADTGISPRPTTPPSGLSWR